jgi:hypothetical protein
MRALLARPADILGKGSGQRAQQATRLAVSLAALVACLLIGAQIALRWESTGFSAVGALNLSSGQILYGNIGIDWSGDFVVRSTTDDEQPPVAVSVASLRILTITQPSTATTPWRLVVGLLLALAAACGAGWSVFKSKSWVAS